MRNKFHFPPGLRSLAILITAIGLAASAYSQSFLTNGLVAYYPFNGNTSDASGNGNDGIFVPATSASSEPTLTTNHLGVANSAYEFNLGSYVYAIVPNLPLANAPRTISGWMKLNASSAPDEETIASWGYADNSASDGSGTAFALWANFYDVDNGRNLYSWGSFNDVSAPYDFNFNTFYYVADSYDGDGNLTLFVNGAPVAQKSIGSYNTSTNGYLLRMGVSTHAAWNSDYLDGSLDNIRIYNRALSTNEIAQLYAIESAPITNAPVLTVQKAIYVTYSNLSPGTNYQLQVSTDLNSWTNSGMSFVATNSTWRSANYWDVSDWSDLYFRLEVSQ
jgi:hypothetical protein